MGKLTRESIPIGAENAITRRELAAMTGLTDRQCRDQIAKLRAEKDISDGYAILSSSHKPSGYWRSDNVQEMETFAKEMKSRKANIDTALQDVHRFGVY